MIYPVDVLHVQHLGSFSEPGSNILEALIDPKPAVCRAMFAAKPTVAGLALVNGDHQMRLTEYCAAMAIQDFMRNRAEKS